MGGARSWVAGDVIPVRHQWRGRVWFAHPAIVVDDTPGRLILFEPAGSIRQWGHFDFATGVIEPPTPSARHTTDALILLSADAAHAVSAFWKQGGGPFLCWYVDMQAPFRRAGGGIVTWDHTLDIVMGPDLVWRWKDQDQLDLAAGLGWMTTEEARLVRAEGERVVEMIESRATPFTESWPDWRPDPTCRFRPSPRTGRKPPENWARRRSPSRCEPGLGRAVGLTRPPPRRALRTGCPPGGIHQPSGRPGAWIEKQVRQPFEEILHLAADRLPTGRRRRDAMLMRDHAPDHFTKPVVFRRSLVVEPHQIQGADVDLRCRERGKIRGKMIDRERRVPIGASRGDQD